MRLSFRRRPAPRRNRTVLYRCGALYHQDRDFGPSTLTVLPRPCPHCAGRGEDVDHGGWDPEPQPVRRGR